MIVNLTNKQLEALSDIAIVARTDFHGNITYVNKKFCDVSGYLESELIGKNHRVLNSGHHSKEFFYEMLSTIYSGKEWRGELKNKRKDGDFYWVDTKIVPLFDEHNKIEGFLSVRFDISHRVKLQQSITNVQKLAQLGELAATIAHEVNNPLTIINLSINSLEKEILNISNSNNSIDLKNINRIKKSISRIDKIVKGLKTISRKSEHTQFIDIFLPTFIEDIHFFYLHKHDDIQIQMNKVPEVKVKICPDKIAQIFINLINNAKDALEENDKLKEKQISIDFKLDEKLKILSILVSNNGPKIKDEILDKIMNPFFSTKAYMKGTGLGLSISKEIAEEHNGKLYCDKNSVNTTFILELPYKEAVEKAA